MAIGDRRFCQACGGTLFRRFTGAPPVERLVCSACGTVSYRNPAVGVAVVVLEGDRILLARRARGRWAGFWCVPCGYVEWDEDIRTAAVREFREETGLEIEVGVVCAVHSNFHDRERQTVGVWFHGRVIGGEARPGDDVDQLEFFALEDPPRLAFPTDAGVISALRAARCPP